MTAELLVVVLLAVAGLSAAMVIEKGEGRGSIEWGGEKNREGVGLGERLGFFFFHSARSDQLGIKWVLKALKKLSKGI